MMQLHTLRLLPRQPVKETLEAYAREHGLQAAFVLSAVGSLTQYHLRFANQEEGSLGTGHFEVVALSGLLSIHGTHLHMAVSDSTGRTVGGHLLPNNLVYTTLEVVLGEALEQVHVRQPDSTYGYKELKVLPR